MITAEDCKRARAEGRAAQIGDVNPYAGTSLALAKIWAAGYNDMLLQRWYSTPTAQRYLANRDTTDGT
ncbi:ribosome modulation factor [Mycobacterium sp. NPDC051198]|uniref:Integrase n=1 Tax=Mycolicibacterium nivoides TaxID=2487344 RepID=A0ABW9L8W8_9MYCO